MQRSVMIVVPHDRPESFLRARKLWTELEAAWPKTASEMVLEPVPCPLALAPSLLRDTGADAVLVFADADDQADMVFHLLDRLWELALPGVLLFDELGRHAEQLAGRTAIAMASNAGPAAIAATLSALMARQALVDELRDEVQVAQRFQGGMRGEIDKIHEELNLAASVQREFLPKVLPTVHGFDCGVFFRPAGYVSGDIYDVKALDGQRAGVFLADAVGHGVPAALMTMVLSRSLGATLDRSHDVGVGNRRDISPSGVMQRLNSELIQRHGDVPRFATAIYAVADPASRTVTLAGAGHPSPLIFSRGAKRAVPVETPGGLLGIFPEDAFGQTTVQLGPDEAMVIYSDGFETAFPEDDADAYQRRVPNKRYLDVFAELASACLERGANGAIPVLTKAVDRGAGSLHQIDDLTAIVLAMP